MKDGYKHGGEHSGSHHMKTGKKVSDAHMKPDATGHYRHEDMGTEAKKATLPGQMYVPKICHNESDFVGDER